MQEDLLEQANAIGKNTLLENFEISFIEVGRDYLIAQMPVTEKIARSMVSYTAVPLQP